jgi:GntR family transcriptional regulator, transcriptional repressor for pyruvate dehydrogenase complex
MQTGTVWPLLVSISHVGGRDGRLVRARTVGTDSAKPVPATEQAAAAIMDMITSGELGPGDRLPTERELALRLDISRSTIREAIRGLNMLRVLDVRHGDGIFITRLDARSLLQVTGFAMQLLRDREVLDMFEVRAILEGAAAALASARITPEQRAELGDKLEVLDLATSSDELLEADIAFHASVAAAAGNPMLASLLDTFSARTYRARYLKASVGFDGIIVEVRAAHRRIYEAVVSRDPEVARAAASAHVAGVASWLRSVLAE